MERVTHDGRTTAYRRVDRGGTGAPLCCVHGSGGTHGVWRSQLGRLSAERPVVALDLSGHGDSGDVDTSAGPETLAAYAADVGAVARETGARVLVGNSLGGAVVLTLLLDDPEALDLEAVVLAGSGAKLAVDETLQSLLDEDFEKAVEVLHREDLFFHDPDPRLVELSKAAMHEAGQAVTRRDFLSCHTFDVRDRLGEVSVPVLALTGEHDGLTPPWYHEYVAEHVPEGEWATVPDAAHLSMLERPDAFNDALTSFLEGL